jgi:hypothetical protein
LRTSPGRDIPRRRGSVRALQLVRLRRHRQQTTQLALFERTKPQLGEGEVSRLEAHQRGATSPVRGFAQASPIRADGRAEGAREEARRARPGAGVISQARIARRDVCSAESSGAAVVGGDRGLEANARRRNLAWHGRSISLLHSDSRRTVDGAFDPLQPPAACHLLHNRCHPEYLRQVRVNSGWAVFPNHVEGAFRELRRTDKC